MHTEPIELSEQCEVAKPRRSFKRRAFRFFLFLSLYVVSALVVAYYAQIGATRVWAYIDRLWDDTMRYLTRVEIVREFVQPVDLPPEQLITKYAQELRVPRIVGLILFQKESGDGENVYRFEPKVYERIKARSRESDSEIRMLASSHGPLQVMGFNAEPRCGIHWSKLYGPQGIWCGLKIMRENLNAHKNTRDIGERAWLAFRDYNGSGPDAERYADHAMSIAGRLMLQQWEKEL